MFHTLWRRLVWNVRNARYSWSAYLDKLTPRVPSRSDVALMAIYRLQVCTSVRVSREAVKLTIKQIDPNRLWLSFSVLETLEKRGLIRAFSDDVISGDAVFSTYYYVLTAHGENELQEVLRAFPREAATLLDVA